MSTYENLGVNGAIVVLESLLDRYEKKHIDGMTVRDVRDHFQTMKDDVRVALAFCKAEKKNKEGIVASLDHVFMGCPKCGEAQADHDGLGVMKCNKCDYCRHASRTNGKCDYCGKEGEAGNE